jgi:hypothetical protein
LLIHVKYKTNVLMPSARQITVVAAIISAESMRRKTFRMWCVLHYMIPFVEKMVSLIQMIVKPARSMQPLRIKENALTLPRPQVLCPSSILKKHALRGGRVQLRDLLALTAPRRAVVRHMLLSSATVLADFGLV